MADQTDKNQALDSVRGDIDALTAATDKVELELANKRNELMLPIYEKRRAVIEKIPNFWTSVFMNNMTLTQIIEPADIPALEHLTDLWVKWDSKDARAYDLTFTFSENPYFSNKELVKKVTFNGEEQVTTPTEIKWKEGKDLTIKDNKRKKGEDNVSDSFFSIFQDDDVTLLDYISNELFAEAIHIYANGGDDDDDFSDEGSVDLDDEDDEDEEDELPAKKKGKK
ncbi:hypothetical protein EMPS_11329 [Entomortierella parvispora]|uniref:Uncharacterized protein n=1 Tax=Entomortierella parvispora TaxID=205924 RepID=A0A9P3M2G7_9FUNG|nr:hypothetical protein EMPS_11329 [Entomortierella parvispora]